MTHPQLPPEPEFVTELRSALREHDDWPTLKSRQAVIDAARSTLNAFDEQRQAVIVAMQTEFTNDDFIAQFKTEGVVRPPGER